MSKAVRGVRKAVKVVAGVGAKMVAKAAKKAWKNPIGRALIIGASIYFGGPALMGALGGGASGAMAGLQTAWGGLQSAGAALAAGNVSGAASAIGNAFMTGVGAGGAGAAAGSGITGVQAGTAADVLGKAAAANGAAGATAGSGMLSTAGNLLQKAAGSQFVSNLAGGALKAYGDAKAQEYAAEQQDEMIRKRKEEEIARMNRNMGTNLFAQASNVNLGPSSFAGRFEAPRY